MNKEIKSISTVETIREEIMFRTYRNNDLREKLPALPGTTYLYRKVKQGWLCTGMVDNKQRDFYADYYTGKVPATGAGGRFFEGEKGKEIAFMPYCITNTNFVTDQHVTTDAVEGRICRNSK